jgi:hypothetical protein
MRTAENVIRVVLAGSGNATATLPTPRPLSGPQLPGSTFQKPLSEAPRSFDNMDSERAGAEFQRRLERGSDVAKVRPLQMIIILPNPSR